MEPKDKFSLRSLVKEGRIDEKGIKQALSKYVKGNDQLKSYINNQYIAFNSLYNTNIGLFTVNQTAEFLGISVQRVYQLVKTDRLKYEKLFNQVFIFGSSIVSYAVSCDGKVGRPSKRLKKH